MEGTLSGEILLTVWYTRHYMRSKALIVAADAL